MSYDYYDVIGDTASSMDNVAQMAAHLILTDGVRKCDAIENACQYYDWYPTCDDQYDSLDDLLAEYLYDMESRV
jgi:hypothetical protein